MADATPNHGSISGNIFAEFRAHPKAQVCEPFAADIKVKASTGNDRYSDVWVIWNNDFIDDVAVHRKSDDWHCRYYFLGDVINFESINYELSAQTVYYPIGNLDMLEFLPQSKSAST
jgi:hypothetical protein